MSNKQHHRRTLCNRTPSCTTGLAKVRFILFGLFVFFGGGVGRGFRWFVFICWDLYQKWQLPLCLVCYACVLVVAQISWHFYLLEQKLQKGNWRQETGKRRKMKKRHVLVYNKDDIITETYRKDNDNLIIVERRKTTWNAGTTRGKHNELDQTKEWKTKDKNNELLQ